MHHPSFDLPTCICVPDQPVDECPVHGMLEVKPLEHPDIVVINHEGTTFTVRYVPSGALYGVDRTLTSKHALVEFYDRAHRTPDFDPERGQFITRYRVLDLLEPSMYSGLDLQGGVAAWMLDRGAFALVRAWLAQVRRAEAHGLTLGLDGPHLDEVRA